MLQIVLLDEKEEYMKASVYFTHAWYDSYLQWVPEEFDNITIIRVPPAQAWNPDIVLLNNVDGKFEVSYECNLLLYSNGMIQWMPPSIYHSSCLMDVLYFPYDTQKCPMKFVSVTYDESQLDITCHDVIFDPFAFSPSAEWKVLSSPCKCTRSPMPGTDLFHIAMVCEFQLRRLSLYYTINFVSPIVILTFLAILGFYLPSETNEKIPLCTSILLSVTMLLLIVVKNFVPTTSFALPLICQYLLFSMIMVSFSIISTVVVLNFHHKPPLSSLMPHWAYRLFIQTLAHWFGITSPSPGFPHSISTSERLRSVMKQDDLVISNIQLQLHDLNLLGAEHVKLPKFSESKIDQRDSLTSGSSSNDPSPSSPVPLRRPNDLQLTSSSSSHDPTTASLLDLFGLMPVDVKHGTEAVNYISSRYIKNDVCKKIKDEWHVFAKVLDRILIIIYMTVIVVGSLMIFLQVPSMRSDSVETVQSLTTSVLDKARRL
ncbi:neuronal acetylcholine receptor subunit beta-4-like isoform X2 [Convolutriloba macropyga]